KHTVRLIVAHEFLSRRIPLQLALELQCNVAQVAYRYGAMAHFHITDRPFPAAQAIQPIPHVIVGDVQPSSVLAQGFLEQLLVAGANVTSVHEDPAVLSRALPALSIHRSRFWFANE